MKEFLVNNWQWIACLVIGTIELFFVIFKKSQKLDTVKEKILALLPAVIGLAEEVFGPGVGSKKKAFVLNEIKQIFAVGHVNLGDSYDSFISSAIESILSTPEKKSQRKENDEK